MTSSRLSVFIALVVAFSCVRTHALVVPAPTTGLSLEQHRATTRTRTPTLYCTMTAPSHKTITSRRTLLGQSLTWAAVLTLAPDSTHAASQEAADKAKIVKGYQRLNYLLDNWDKETTVCKTGGDNPYIGCERTPVKVMEYLGYKSMDDPLFKVEKTLMRLSVSVPGEYDSEFQDAMESIVEKADEGNGMAFVSSWGEANPGGGKDRVEYFIERSKDDVIVVRDNLKRIMRILDLKA